ncbi:helix-turn-helix transcriptional regulator [Streptomyces sp. YIM 132580]|uniref:helix-turn-helix transcriptional regulator n=1 Tax=Streptomyces sp. YIM 132580 TaxID=2691958 RepID=UPI0013715E2B|nr:hypothetical protein [Streptomyces sp. YIM 132580]MXG27074.1 hypothetical protein [Streptomyces sp. YIM 132580]
MPAATGAHQNGEYPIIEQDGTSFPCSPMRRVRFRRGEVAEDLGLSPEESVGAERVLSLLGLLEPAFGKDQLVPVSLDKLTRLTRSARPASPTRPPRRPAEATPLRERETAQPSAPTPASAPRSLASRRIGPATTGNPQVETVSDPALLRVRLEEMNAHCQQELLLIQPGGARPAATLPAARLAALSLLERGVRMRVLYQHAARGDTVTRALVRELSRHGAQVRTDAELTAPLVAYDQETVFLPEAPDPATGECSGKAAVIRDPTLVAFTCGAFERLWNAATPFLPATEDAAPVIDDLKAAIVRLMALGHKDEMVARRLGMSVRTCRRHIAEIMETTDATSRFQAGVRLTRAGILDHSAPDSTALFTPAAPPGRNP